MDLSRIKALIDVMSASALSELSMTHEGWTLTLKRDGAVAEPQPTASLPTPQPVATPTALPPVSATQAAKQVPAAAAPLFNAPLFGVLHWQASPDEPTFIKVGDQVKAGQTICVIEAMKVFNTISADRDGVVEALLAESGTEVDVGHPLIRFK